MQQYIRPPVLVALFFFICAQAYAQKKINRKDSIRNEKIRQGKMVFSQAILPGSAPETGFLVGSISAFTFTMDPSDTSLQRSSVPIVAYVSVRGAVGFLSEGNILFKKKIRWLNSIRFNHVVDNYWGVGYEAGSSIERSEDSTQYIKNNFRWNPKVLRAVSRKFFAGVQTEYSLTVANDPNTKMQQDEAFIKYGDRVSILGVGLVAQYDSRDLIVNTWNGTLIELSWLNYPASWATGDGYSTLGLEYRQFKKIGNRSGKTLAWNFRTKLGFGDIPWPELPSVGTDNSLRAYYGGRYRDQNSAHAMIEYRHTFKSGSGLSKHGFVVWTGAGEIWNDELEFENTLPVIGAGYRFALQPRINLRVDFGVGRDSFGFYINVTEAF
jgi:hypothetical protein